MRLFSIILILSVAIFISGCGVFQKAHRADELEAQVGQLKTEIDKLQALSQEKDTKYEELKSMKEREIQRLLQEKEKQISQVKDESQRQVGDLEMAKERLARDLQKEIEQYRAKLQITEKGLVITFIDEVLFDSGKAKIKEEGIEVLNKVAQVLKTEVKDSDVEIEGHTDNEPIKYSGWKSNWELSCTRALSVLHYFIDEQQIEPIRLKASGFGEFKPVATNDSAQGRQQNRRVEIVILPKKLTKIKSQE